MFKSLLPQKMSSGDAPNGQGWFKISEQTYINNSTPLKANKMVYKGKQKVNGEWGDIAVKLIPYDEKSLKEVKLQLKVDDHPNIIQLYDANVIHGGIIPHIYVAMELCSQTLKDFIEEHKNVPLDFELHFHFTKQIVSAVAHIHQCNIIHRDVKLENILLSSAKDNVRVADFGLSKQLLEGYSVATASFRGLGTDGYRAPELLREKPEASFRSDSFSLGIVLAMFFSNGQHPFGPDPSRWRTNITDNKGQDLTHIVVFKEPNSHKRALLVDLIEQCLQYNPRKRPTPERMLQHEFFSDPKSEGQVKRPMTEGVSNKLTAGSETLSGTRVESEKIKETPTFLPDDVIDDGDLMEPDEDVADSIDQFLIARKKKLERLEKNLANALRNGQSSHLQILGELKNLTAMDELEAILPLVEYELVSKKNDACIEKVHRVISDAGTRTAWDVRQKGLILQERGEYVQSMILFKLAHDLHKAEGRLSPDNEAEWIHHRVTDITNAQDSLLKAGGRLREIAVMHGLRPVEQMLHEIRALDGATPSVRALQEIGCLVNITGDLCAVREYEKCIRYGEEGIAMMKRQFGENAEYYKDFGSVLNNIGNAYGNVGQYSKGHECLTKAIEVKSKAKDYESEENRQKDVASTEHNLKNNRKRTLKNPFLTGMP